ncbi:MAG TPA: RdgB/HAM1 family non-canonical purine NTP pyrophosphatase [Candidatus Hydrogenedentes bacterium]|nr:RdgB/HAM1 family non-canonical purine NTP pyrophosphatase [Candidatus Hydrogenedentota bacterium]HOK89419.1 RdgB/HAM1 family non-canonical purine NTP pyrophosphatase [Candidatus Hydrogenedentota bacterium]
MIEPGVIVAASGNRKKARELEELLRGTRWQVKSLAEFPGIVAPEETGTTFEANARLKALYYAEKTGNVCLADDSGLVVDYLNGEPGVNSAYYAGPQGDDEANNAKLLAALRDVPWHLRTARFVCCVAVAFPGNPEVHFEWGEVEGHIAVAPFGSNGFGYDPLFVPLGYEETFGELDPAVKHRLSHRGRALERIRAWLESLS